MSTYLIIILCTGLAAFGLFALLNARRTDSRGVLAAAVSFPLCAVLGFVFAKLFYVFLSEVEVFLEWGEWEWDALFDLDPSAFCFTGGAVGVWIGILLASRITGYRPAAVLADRFALPGALLIAGLRIAEVELGTLGTGRIVENPSFLIPVV